MLLIPPQASPVRISASQTAACCSDWIENESKSKMGKKRKTFFPLNTLLELRRRRGEGRRGKRGRRGKGEEGEKEGEERRRGRAGELGCE